MTPFMTIFTESDPKIGVAQTPKLQEKVEKMLRFSLDIDDEYQIYSVDQDILLEVSEMTDEALDLALEERFSSDAILGDGCCDEVISKDLKLVHKKPVSPALHKVAILHLLKMPTLIAASFSAVAVILGVAAVPQLIASRGETPSEMDAKELMHTVNRTASSSIPLNDFARLGTMENSLMREMKDIEIPDRVIADISLNERWSALTLAATGSLSMNNIQNGELRFPANIFTPPGEVSLLSSSEAIILGNGLIYSPLISINPDWGNPEYATDNHIYGGANMLPIHDNIKTTYSKVEYFEGITFDFNAQEYASHGQILDGLSVFKEVESMEKYGADTSLFLGHSKSDNVANEYGTNLQYKW